MIKKSSASSLRKKGVYYTSVSNEVTKAIKNSDALAIWIYLMTQSDGFIIRASHLQDHFSLGEIRYKKAMDYLKQEYLLRKVTIRDEEGKILDNELECYGEPYLIENKEQKTEFPEIRAFGEINNLNDKPSSLKTPSWVNHEAGENRALIKNQEDLIKEKEREIKEQALSPSFDKDSQTIKTLCSRLKLKGIAGASPLNAELIALLNDEVSADYVLEVATEAVERDKKSLGWITATIIGRRDDARKMAEKPKVESKPAKVAPSHASHIEVQPEPPKRAKAPPSALAMLEEQKKMFSMPRKE